MSPATQPTPDWIVNELKTGLKKLLTLSLEGQPSADVIGGTLAVWIEVICSRRVFDEATDVQRFRDAFRILMERECRWPNPAKFLEALPTNVVAFQKRPKLEDENRRKAGFQALAEINKKLGIPLPRDDDPTPPRAA
jgi:hypothetical protein